MFRWSWVTTGLHLSVPAQDMPSQPLLAMLTVLTPSITALQGWMTPMNKTKELLCSLHLPSTAWGAASLAMAKCLGWKCFLQLSVQEHVAPRTQVAGGDITLCVCVLTALNSCSMQLCADIYGLIKQQGEK